MALTVSDHCYYLTGEVLRVGEEFLRNFVLIVKKQMWYDSDDQIAIKI